MIRILINGNSSDGEYNVDRYVDQISQELIVEEENEIDDAEDSAIRFSEWSEFSGRQKSFSFSGTVLVASLSNYLAHQFL